MLFYFVISSDRIAIMLFCRSIFFFFKQKTAYEMRISDWSSDVCSSDLPTIVFMQSGYNVYTLQQAARRSWRIGQQQAVRVIYLGYAATSQMTCLSLMAKKILVSQSTSGDVPESGLDVLNPDGDSVEVALARQLVAA